MSWLWCQCFCESNKASSSSCSLSTASRKGGCNCNDPFAMEPCPKHSLSSNCTAAQTGGGGGENNSSEMDNSAAASTSGTASVAGEKRRSTHWMAKFRMGKKTPRQNFFLSEISERSEPAGIGGGSSCGIGGGGSSMAYIRHNFYSEGDPAAMPLMQSPPHPSTSRAAETFLRGFPVPSCKCGDRFRRLERRDEEEEKVGQIRLQLQTTDTAPVDRDMEKYCIKSAKSNCGKDIHGTGIDEAAEAAAVENANFMISKHGKRGSMKTTERIRNSI